MRASKQNNETHKQQWRKHNYNNNKVERQKQQQQQQTKPNIPCCMEFLSFIQMHNVYVHSTLYINVVYRANTILFVLNWVLISAQTNAIRFNANVQNMYMSAEFVSKQL